MSVRGACFTFLVGMVALGCNGSSEDTDVAVAPTGPELSWVDQPSADLVEGESLTLRVEAADDDGVSRVATYFRTQGSRTWLSAPEMEYLEEEDVWTVLLEGSNIQAPGLELYFKGEDTFGQASFLPANGLREPFTLGVRRVGVSLPYTESFDEVLNDDLREIGWSEINVGFGGYDWAITTARSFSGDRSVSHRNTPSTVQNDIEDWLISPPLDLSSVPAAQISWMEYGVDGALASHSVWLSTGSPDPRDGEFQLVEAVPAPEDGSWSRSKTVDLSAFAGEPAAYVALVYSGKQADVWWVDDVTVEALGPALKLSSVAWTPQPLSPGDKGTLTATLVNETTVDAVNVSVSADGGETIVFGAAPPVASIPGNGSAEVAIPFTVSPSAPDNAWADYQISVSLGANASIFEDRVLIGQPSTLSIAYTIDPLDEMDTEQLVRARYGVGPVDAPLFEAPLVGELVTSGTYSLEVDVTELDEYLPPVPGENRWWVRFENGPSGTVDSFEISLGGEVYASNDVGAFFGFAPSDFFLPQPPAFSQRLSSTAPATVAPGDSVSWTVSLQNIGESTSGETTISVSTSDPLVSLTDAGPKSMTGPDGWESGEQMSATFGFDVSGARKSSIPIPLLLTITDAYETFEVESSVAVPWPVLGMSGLLIDDSAEGDGDGILDPEESATLEITIANTGDLGTFGATTCTLSQTGGPASLSITTSSVFAGIVGAGSTEEEDFDVSVTAGALSDSMTLQLSCADRDEVYVSEIELVLGERPWIRLSALDDAVGDVFKSYRFDFETARYRSDGTTLEVQLVSATPHGGLSGLFLEAWANSSGADYTYYQFVSSGSTANIRGYRSSFTPLGSFTVTEVDAKTIQWDIPLGGLSLRTGADSMRIGFGAGFCGGTPQFCDHYPDGWGAPYTGLSTSRWATMRW